MVIFTRLAFLFTSVSAFCSFDIVGLGAPIMDYSIFVDGGDYSGDWKAISYDELQHILKEHQGTYSMHPGGSGTNLIKGIARMGKRCALTGQIGNDAIASRFTERVRSYNIETHYATLPSETGQSVCFVTPDGQRTMRTFLGAAHHVGIPYVDESLIKQAKWVHIEGYQLIDHALVNETIFFAKKHGTKVSLDLANAFIVKEHKEFLDGLLGKIDLLFSNEDEATAYTGLNANQSIEVMRKKCPRVVITLGNKGCLICGPGEKLHLPAMDVPVIDTTGAGDLFAGGFLLAMIDGHSLKEAGWMGSLLAGQVIQVTGAEIPERSWDYISTKINSRHLALKSK